MECVLLGSGGMMPMPHRLLTSVAVKTGGRLYLFDAGEGTQIGLKAARMGLGRLAALAVTHLHADHCLGLPGLLMLRSQIPNPCPLAVLGPPGIREFVLSTQRLLGFHLAPPVRFVEWAENRSPVAWEDEAVRISWLPLEHTRFCLGYRLEEPDRPGRFHAEKAEALGIPSGPLRGRLQRGETVMLPDGTEITPADILGPRRRGRRIAYAVDTRPVEAVVELCRGVDIAFLDGMFHSAEAEHAREKGHMTVAEAARAARKAGAHRCVLVHLSPRYQDEDLDRLEQEARKEHPGAAMGRDLQRFDVPLPGDETAP